MKENQKEDVKIDVEVEMEEKGRGVQNRNIRRIGT